jgi:hypothetical protein
VAADRTVPGGVLTVVVVFSWAVRQEYVGRGGIDLLSFLMCTVRSEGSTSRPDRFTTVLHKQVIRFGTGDMGK